jgi:vacuolar-type H+-ATPase subunit E/Vma4
MATQNVIDKIIENAQKEAQDILDQYTRNAQEIRKNTQARIANLHERHRAEAQTLQETETTRAISQKRLEHNRIITSRKRQMATQAIEQALISLPQHKEYPEFLKALIQASKQAVGDITISVNDWQKHKDTLQSYFKKNKLAFKIKTDKHMLGGITIAQGKKVFHGSLALIAELLHDELTIAVSQELF